MSQQDKDATVLTGFRFSLSSDKIVSVEFVRNGDNSAIGHDRESGRSSWTFGSWTIGKDLFLTADEARVAALAQRDKRVESLRAQIKKLEKMTFAKVVT